MKKVGLKIRYQRKYSCHQFNQCEWQAQKT